jgi:hypothetical protein
LRIFWGQGHFRVSLNGYIRGADMTFGDEWSWVVFGILFTFAFITIVLTLFSWGPGQVEQKGSSHFMSEDTKQFIIKYLIEETQKRRV